MTRAYFFYVIIVGFALGILLRSYIFFDVWFVVFLALLSAVLFGVSYLMHERKGLLVLCAVGVLALSFGVVRFLLLRDGF